MPIKGAAYFKVLHSNKLRKYKCFKQPLNSILPLTIDGFRYYVKVNGSFPWILEPLP